MTQLFANILPIFIICFIGAIVKSNWLQAEEFWRGLEKLSYFILFPSTLINFIYLADFNASRISSLILSLSLATLCITGGLIYYQTQKKFDGKTFTSILQGGIRYNSYIFFAIGRAIFDTEGMSLLAAVSAYMIILTNIISISAFNAYVAKPDSLTDNWILFLVKTLFKNPLIIASIIGVLFNYLQIHLPTGIQNTLNLLANAAFPIGCLIIGAGLKLKFNNLDTRLIAKVSILKLLVLPTLAALFMKIFAVEGNPKTVGLLYSALPTATNSYILSKQLGGDSELISSIITVTTISALFSIFFIIYIFA